MWQQGFLTQLARICHYHQSIMMAQFDPLSNLPIFHNYYQETIWYIGLLIHTGLYQETCIIIRIKWDVMRYSLRQLVFCIAWCEFLCQGGGICASEVISDIRRM
ncbi:hypothetical protein HanPI659440_Chr14g0559261 [Helianthus annuus]|nr:hypothetical protein HanPI659440_Chr14g0559261 [Helianthus annuus]